MHRSLLAVSLAAALAPSARAAAPAAAVGSEQHFVESLGAIRAAALQQGPSTRAVWRTVAAPKRFFYGVSYRDAQGKTHVVRSAYDVCMGHKQLLDDVLYGIGVRRAMTRCANYGNLAEFGGTIEALVESPERR